MMTYILLRNNKELGPYSLEGLRETGLSPNDLVWVEGQSVCWLRPSEIQELKTLVAANGKPSPPEKPLVAEETVTVEKKKRPVAIPVSGKNTTLNNGEYSAYQPLPETDAISPVLPLTVGKEEKAVAETKYSRPLDELKELYAKDLEKRLRRKGFALQVPPAVKKAGLYLAFLAVGLVAGILVRNSGKDSKEVGSVIKPGPETASSTLESPETPGEATVTVPEPVIPATAYPAQNTVEPTEPVNEIPPVTKERAVKKTNTATVKETTADAGITEKPIPSKTGTEQHTREAAVRESQRMAPPELATLVSVKSNDYIVGSFGGIKNLQLTVMNSSVYKLDRVTVELQYLKPMDELLKAENIVFNSIAPGGSQTLAIPKSSRGVKVRCRVIRIESDEVSGNTAGN